MTDNLNQYIDLIYENKHEQIPAAQMQIIGRALLLERQGQTATQIAKEIGLNPQEVKELVIRCKGWEVGEELKAKKSSRYS
jgi:hypothetical protein